MRALILVLLIGACGDHAEQAPTDAPPGSTFVVVNTSPADGATRVVPGTSVSVHFNDELDPATLTAASFVISGVDGALSSSATSATFDPGSQLAPGMYTVTLSSEIASTSGVALTPYTFTFTVSLDIERQVFVTSTEGSGDLSTWAEAGGTQGVAAGDAICQARAAAGGLDGTFVAFLSDATTDAYCHVLGLTGRRNTGCGVGTLPEAGPWVRTDGTPFATFVPLPTGGRYFQIYNPPRYDEAGVRIADSYIFTGSDDNGVGEGECDAWTDTADDTISVAGTFVTAAGWSSGVALAACSSSNHLLCFEQGAGPALIFPPRTGNLVFLTSTAGTATIASWPEAGGQGGLAGADAICRARASAAALANADRFEALLADATTPMFDRLAATGPFVRPDGSVVALSKTAFSSGQIESTIHQTEAGAYTGGLQTWTGRGGQDTCTSWTGAGLGGTGKNWHANASMLSSGGSTLCTEMNRLYCVED